MQHTSSTRFPLVQSDIWICMRKGMDPNPQFHILDVCRPMAICRGYIMFWETCMNSETKPAAISQSKSLNPFNNTQYKTRCICSEKHGRFQKPNLWIEARLYSLPWKTLEQAHISIACKNIEWRIHYTFNGYIEKCVWSTLDPWLCDLLSCAICWAVRSVHELCDLCFH